jgi:hypothetical protein
MSGAKGIVIDAGIECRQRGHWLVSVTVGGGPNLAPLACLGAARSREKAELAMTKAVMLAEEAMRAASPEAFFAAAVRRKLHLAWPAERVEEFWAACRPGGER